MEHCEREHIGLWLVEEGMTGTGPARLDYAMQTVSVCIKAWR